MSSATWHALSPLDGRYLEISKALAPYFSEYSLMRYRVGIEISYLLALIEHPLPELVDFPPSAKKKLQSISENFGDASMARIKEIESRTRHDLKAVEYYIKEQMTDELEDYKEFVHLGLTSQDINHTALPLSLKDAYQEVLRPELDQFLSQLKEKATAWQSIPMLAHTHGQAATPTSLGREIEVFVTRLEAQLKTLDQIPFSAKFGGATGGMNAHLYAYPEIDWSEFAEKFVKSLGLLRSYPTTQIEPYDNVAALFDALGRVSTILIDYARDMWQYIAMEYMQLSRKKEEIGSSTMPHKINPIDFENAEGNLGLARAMGRHFSEKLPISRLQRDLSDSTVIRNVGIPLGHLLLALKNLNKGTEKLTPHRSHITEQLERQWPVITEGVQVLLRRISYPRPYEEVKKWLQSSETLDQFIALMSKEVRAHLSRSRLPRAIQQAYLDQLCQLRPQDYKESLLPANLEMGNSAARPKSLQAAQLHKKESCSTISDS